MKLKTKEKIYILISVFFISLFVFYFFSYQFFFKGMNKKIHELKEVEREMSYFQAKISQLKEIKKKEKEIKEGIEKLKALFVDKELPLDFIKFLEEASKNCQAELEIKRFYDLSSRENKEGLLFELNAKGNFYNIFCFLKKIENGPYLVSFQKFNLYSEEKTKNKFFLFLSLIAFVK
jgi:Tfp pilus assembly protein PilO